MFHNLIYYTDTPVVSPDFCNDLIHKFELDHEKHQGLTTSIGLDYTQMTDEQKQKSLSVKCSTDLYISDRQKYHNEHSILFGAISKTLDEYRILMESNIQGRTFKLKTPHSRLSGFNLQRTSPGEYFHWHSDELIMGTWYRGISYIIYLNDIHHDGYTEFYDGTIIQPKQGHVMMFPATWTYVHRGVPPVDETKYICVGWWETISHVHYTPETP